MHLPTYLLTRLSPHFLSVLLPFLSPSLSLSPSFVLPFACCIRFYSFPDYIEKMSFGVSCDAFSAFRDLLTRHKPMVAGFLEGDYDRFFSMYTGLLNSSNYVTKRQSLKLLGEILLDKTNFAVMTRYIGNEQNLKLMMNLLKDRSKNIQFEAFHVFKVFVANPRKPPAVEHILRRNRDRLVAFLSDFHNDRDDEQFADEKQYIIQIIEQTGHSPTPHAPAAAADEIVRTHAHAHAHTRAG